MSVKESKNTSSKQLTIGIVFAFFITALTAALVYFLDLYKL